MEGDAGPLYHAARRVDFYPRPPGGGRLNNTTNTAKAKCISIHALRVEGDRGHLMSSNRGDRISIHALRVEGDLLFIFLAFFL